MELKLSYGLEVQLPRLFSNSRHKFKARYLQFCSCRGIVPRASGSSISPNGTSSVGQQRHLNSRSYQINEVVNGTSSNLRTKNDEILDALGDEYEGVIINPETLPSNPNIFASALRSSLHHWKIKGKKGVWLKLPPERCDLVPIAIQEGFEYHHAEKSYVMMTYWIPDGPSLIPCNASHHVGVGSFVINEKDELLVVQEKHSIPSLFGLWKIPTGFIHESEEIYTGAVREVKEETGVREIFSASTFSSNANTSSSVLQQKSDSVYSFQIDSEFVEVVAFRHAQNVSFGKSDLFFVCMLRPLSSKIKVDDIEIQAAKWMALDEYVNQPLIQGDSMFKKIVQICIARHGKRYCGLSVHQLVSIFDSKLSTLYFNVVEDGGDSGCHTN